MTTDLCETGCGKPATVGGVCEPCCDAMTPDGDRWPHETCGEAGSYCDSECHGHEHVDYLDGSVDCIEKPTDEEPFEIEGGEPQ